MTAPVRIVTIPVDELQQLVRDAVRAELAEQRPAEDEWMDAEAVAKMLSVERTTVPTLCRRDGLPHYRPGRTYTFRRSEVLAWLQERSKRPGSHGGRHGRTLRAVRGGQ